MIPNCILVIENDDDREFMTQLYFDYSRLMYSEIKKIIKREQDREDVMQTVLEKLIDKIPLLRSRTHSQLINYIISACKFTSFNLLRDSDAKKETGYEDYLTVPSAKQNEREIELRMIADEELEALRRVLPKLDLRTQCLLEGYYILEKPMAELGAELGIKPSSVRMSLTRARKKAFELLKREEIEGVS